jgi:plastocyanin
MSMKRIGLVSVITIFGVGLAGSLLFVGFTQTQTLPAPTVDRVEFPTGYKDTFKLFYTFDNYQNRQIRKVYGNSIAASVSPGEVFNFPYGSVILFESYTVQQDATGEPVLDDQGRFIPVNLTTIFVMRKERGFGADYKDLRNGEWEYVAYRPDGSYANPPSTTGACALCHLTGGGLALSSTSRNIGAQWDYVFRPDLYFAGGTGAVPKGIMQHYLFVPSTIRAQAGETVTVYNYDQLLHRIVADDGSFDTGLMTPGASFTVKAGAAGTAISYHCTLHNRMTGKIVVDPPPIVLGVTGIIFSPASARVGGTVFTEFSGTNLTNQTFFDVRFRAPGSTADQEIFNWQRGTSGTHSIPAGTATGTWTLTGVRAHQADGDHSGSYATVSAVLTIMP